MATKTSAKKTPAKKAAQKAAAKAARKATKRQASNVVDTTEPGEVTVRMFCQGLGDCFLISFGQRAGRAYHLLIDCGIAKGTKDADGLMNTVVKCISKLTGGTVDLLVVTHEHYDHVSGFYHAEDLLKNGSKADGRLAFKNFWFPWTEKPGEPLADELREKYSKAKASLAIALSGMEEQTQRRFAGILAFSGFGEGGIKAGAAGMETAMKNLRGLYRPNGEEVSYLMPKTIRPLPGATAGVAKGLQAYVLGPPHDAKSIRKTNPSEANPETYEKKGHLALGLTAIDTLMAALSEDSSAYPFDPQWRVLKEDEPTVFSSYFESSPQNVERRIDGDWIQRGAQQLALHIETYTNNVSLVLALELPKSKGVLLFPGDAQVGNWKSWHEGDFTTASGKTISARDLLERTVFYKVGHHGSHNATMKEMGLELMTHEQLVAMIPVEAGAVKRLSYGEMPVESLETALDKNCDGRVIRLDQTGKWDDGSAPGNWAGLKRATRAKQTIQTEAGELPLYVEYTILDKD